MDESSGNMEGPDLFQEEDYDESSQDYDELDDDIKQVNQEIKIVTKDIKSSYKKIFSTLKEIQQMKNQYTILKNTISSLRSAPIGADGFSSKSSRISGQSSQATIGEGQISSSHQLKINGKRKDIVNLQNEIDQNLNKTLQNLGERLNSLLEDERDSEIKLVVAENAYNTYRINTRRNELRTEFYKDQIKDRKKELQQLRALKADAEKSLGILMEREKRCFLIDNQEDSEKLIASLQDELVKLETQMQSVRKRIYIFKENAEIEMYQYQVSKQQNIEAANWKEEKATLTSTLKDLKEKVRILKQHQVYYPSEMANSVISPGEAKSDALTPEERDIYGSIIRKYSNALINKTVTEPSDNFNNSGNLKNSDNWNLILEPRIKLAKLMDENAKTEKLLARKKEMLQLIVERFRRKEKDLIDNSPKVIEDFQEQEKQLLDKIHKLKLKLAQERLNNEMK